MDLSDRAAHAPTRHAVASWLRESARAAGALAFPVSCAGCGEPDTSVCLSCRAAMHGPVRDIVLDDDLRVTCGVDFDGAARRVISNFKGKQRVDAAPVLAQLLARVARYATRTLSEPVSFVPIPSSRRAWRRRGYVPLSLIARRVDIRYDKVLYFRRQPRDQRELGKQERQTNVCGSMGVRRAPRYGSVFIVDDVVTTGATMREARQCLQSFGICVVGGIALARTPHFPDRTGPSP